MLLGNAQKIFNNLQPLTGSILEWLLLCVPNRHNLECSVKMKRAMLHSKNILQSFDNEELYSFEEEDRLTLDQGQAICVIETNNQNSNDMETTYSSRRMMRLLEDEAEALRQAMTKQTLDEMMHLAEYGY